MPVYKMTNDDYGMLLSTAKFNVAVDASSGSVRIQIYVACPTHQALPRPRSRKPEAGTCARLSLCKI